MSITHYKKKKRAAKAAIFWCSVYNFINPYLLVAIYLKGENAVMLARKKTEYFERVNR